MLVKMTATRAIAAAIAAAAIMATADAHCVVSLTLESASGLANKGKPFVEAKFAKGAECASEPQSKTSSPRWAQVCPDRAFTEGDEVQLSVLDKKIFSTGRLGSASTPLLCPAEPACETRELPLDTAGSVTVRMCTRPVALPDTCRTVTRESSTCAWYGECLDQAVPCGGDPSEYALNYGQRKCLDFGDAAPGFSASGLDWMENTRACLQRALISRLSDPTECTALRDEAFTSHINCYLGDGGKYGSICSVVFTDLWAILKAIRGDLFALETLTQALPVGKDCALKLALGGLRIVGTLDNAALRGAQSRSSTPECLACVLDEAISAQLVAAAPAPAETTVQLAGMKPVAGDPTKVEIVLLVAAKERQASDISVALLSALADSAFELPLANVKASAVEPELAELGIAPQFTGRAVAPTLDLAPTLAPTVLSQAQPSDADELGNSDGLSTTVVAASAVGGVAALGVVVAAAVAVQRRRTQRGVPEAPVANPRFQA